MPTFLDTEFPKHPFWDYSLTVYADSRVKEACLYLQYRYRLNVNILLFCCWLAKAGYAPFSEQDFMLAKQAIEKWHNEVTSKIRALRNQIKQQTLKNTASNIELTAECVEQLLLAELASQKPTKTYSSEQQIEIARSNLRNYLKSINDDLANREQQMIENILSAIDVTYPA